MKTTSISEDSNTERRKIIAFTAMVFGMFMSILDIQIVSSSLAEIQSGLGVSSSEASWVQTSYLIAEVIMIPLSGFLGKLLSTRVVFSLAAAGFTISSVLCATATTLPEMILYRALQGFIGGAMIPNVFAAAFVIFPPEKRNIVSPIVGLVATLAPTIGPTFGGYLSHSLSWHWLFLINIPPGILVTYFAWRYIDFDKPNHALFKKFDWWGLIGLALFLGCLEYVLEEGPRNSWFQDNIIVLCTSLMISGAILFFWRAFTAEEPIVDLSAFSNLNFSLGSFFSFIMGMGLYGLTFLYPLYLGQIRNFDSLMIGKTLFVSGIAMLIAAPLSGILSSRVDSRLLMALGFLGFGFGTWIVTDITADWDFWELFWPQILRGFSMMLCMVQINNVALGTLPKEKIKTASGVYNLTRNLGGAVGLAFLNTIILKRSDFHYDRVRESVNPANYEATKTLHLFDTIAPYSDTSQNFSIMQVHNIVTQQSTVMAFADAFFILTIFFFCLTLLVGFVKKPKQAVEDVH